LLLTFFTCDLAPVRRFSPTHQSFLKRQSQNVAVGLRGWPTGRLKQLFERSPAVLLIKTNKKAPDIPPRAR